MNRDHVTPRERVTAALWGPRERLAPRATWREFWRRLAPNKPLLPEGKPRLVHERDDIVYIRFRGMQ